MAENEHGETEKNGNMIRTASIAFLLSATAATAQMCGPSERFIDELVKKAGEEPVVQLKQSGGAYLVILINPEKGNWSVLNVRPDGFACMMGAGQGYVNKMKKPGEDS